MVLSAGFLVKKFNKIRYISLGPLCNVTFTNKLLIKAQNKKKKLSLQKFFILHFC